MLSRMERVIAPVVRAYNGRVVKSIGDAYMIVFASPTEAVRCSTAVQDRLHQHNANTTADQAIHIRIAMNIGEVRVHRGDVYGEPVNIAARIEAVTPADDIFLSEAIYLTMNRYDLPIEHVGDYELKGIPEPVTVYRVRKFSHLNEDEAEESETSPTKAHGLPFGGSELDHWKKVSWLRRAYMAMWVVGVLGLAGAAYLRYRPSSDYSELVAAAETAAETNDAQGVLAAVGRIPVEATHERGLVRSFRLRAVSTLINSEDYETAGSELLNMLSEDARDPDALMLQALLALRQSGDLKSALADLEDALKVKPRLASRAEVIEVVVQGYAEGNTRRDADRLVEVYLQQKAVRALSRALTNGLGDRLARKAIATRMEKLGASDEVDWVVLAIEDLRSTSCKVRKTAINRLLAESDDRAVGPLMKLAESRSCGAQPARRAAEAILK